MSQQEDNMATKQGVVIVSILAFQGLMLLLSMGLVGLIIYAAIHFISKFW
jgi:hypothetical protein